MLRRRDALHCPLDSFLQQMRSCDCFVGQNCLLQWSCLSLNSVVDTSHGLAHAADRDLCVSVVHDISSAKKLYLVDEKASASETSEKRPIAECGLPSRIGNAEFEHKIQSVLFKLLNSGRKTMNTNFSPATNDYSHITPSSEYAGVKDIKSVETTRKPLRKKIVEKRHTRNTDRKAKKTIVPVQWDPIVF